MDDPIFDPWCLGDENRPAPAKPATRWHQREAENHGVPMAWPAPKPSAPRNPPPLDAEPEARSDRVAPRVRTPRPTPTHTPARVSRRDYVPPPEPKRRPPVPTLQPTRPPAQRCVAASLTTLLLPVLNNLRHRLDLAGHETTLDDRQGHTPPSIRFRIDPWHGPLDEPGATAAAILEVIEEGPESLRANIWLDPLATEPTEQIPIPSAEFGDARMERLLLHFVERALAPR